MAGLSALAVFGLGCVYLITEHFIERRALREEMTEELRALMDHESRGEHVALFSTILRYFPRRCASGPCGVAAGDVSAASFRRKTLQVLTAAEATGGTHVLVHDMTLAEQREKSLWLSLVAGGAIAAAGAWWASGRLSRSSLESAHSAGGGDPPHRSARAGQAARIPDRRRRPERHSDAVNALIQELDHVLQRERSVRGRR